MTDDHRAPSTQAPATAASQGAAASQSSAASQGAADKKSAPAEVGVALTPLRITLGILAIIIGIGSGIIMSSATLFK